jgi:hypothetical protein
LTLPAGQRRQQVPTWFLRTRSAEEDTPLWLEIGACVFTSRSKEGFLELFVTLGLLKLRLCTGGE